MSDDSEKVTPESVKSFITDAKKARESWLVMANRSWDEIKRQQKGKRLWSTIPNAVRKKTKYPAWWSIFKIRQPLLLSRIGIPIGKDTTQDGNDPLGACAAACKERLATNLAKSFDFYDVMSSARDDFLATNVGFVRAYYEAKDVKEAVKIRLAQVPDEEGNLMYVNPDGEVITEGDIQQDDEGFFLETNKIVDVTEEKICLEHILYNNTYVDPSIKRWAKCKQVAFEVNYTEAEFKYIFGKKAFKDLPKTDDDSDNKSKKTLIKVYEYWDLYTKETVWLPENGDEFISPKDYIPSSEEVSEHLNGLYDLEAFFPMVKPLVMNQPTDQFWPIPEYYQLQDILEEIHTIFSRIMALTKAIRARILYDSNVEGLREALAEFTDQDSMGISNLTQSLVNSGGTLDGVVQYVPVEKLIQSIEQVYAALEQRLNTLYKLTGTSDLLQGLITDPTQRTFGERQMTEKYALNQVAVPQRSMAEFVRDGYELLCEMALKNFKDESLSRFIMPETLQPDMQSQYQSALELLKSNNKRFRIELETDSTIALNEEFDKQMRMQLVDTVTNALEKTANIAQNSPALIVPELHLLKFLIQGFRQGKLFQSEVTQAIDQVIQQAQQVKEPAFNKDEANNAIKQQELQLRAQEIQGSQKLEEYKILSDERYKTAQLQTEQMLAQVQADVSQVTAQAENMRTQVESQIEMMKVQSQNEQMLTDARIAYQKIQSDVAVAQENILVKRQELAAKMQDNASKAQLEQLQFELDARIAEHDAQITVAAQSLQQQKVMLDEQEKFATEKRLQSEHQMAQMQMALQAAKDEHERQIQAVQAMQPQINIAQPVEPKPKKQKRKLKVVRDKKGNMQAVEIEHEEEK